jgi:hypothetical protein
MAMAPVTILLAVVGFCALVVVLVALAVCASVRSMSEPSLVALPAAAFPVDQSAQWAEANEFAFIGYFRFQNRISLAAWRRTDRPTFFTHMRVQGKETFDLVTLFADDVALTTGSSADAQVLPLPAGFYCQSFSGAGLDERWDRHIEAENYLMDAGGARLVQTDVSLEDAVVRYVRRQVAHVRGLSMWPFRGVYWFVVRRQRMHNLSVQKQHERGMIMLPNELPARASP